MINSERRRWYHSKHQSIGQANLLSFVDICGSSILRLYSFSFLTVHDLVHLDSRSFTLNSYLKIIHYYDRQWHVEKENSLKECLEWIEQWENRAEASGINVIKGCLISGFSSKTLRNWKSCSCPIKYKNYPRGTKAAAETDFQSWRHDARGEAKCESLIDLLRWMHSIRYRICTDT